MDHGRPHSAKPSGEPRNAILEEILDWRPFDCYRVEVKLPVPLVKPIRITYELEDLSAGTRVTEYTSTWPGVGQRLAYGMLMRMMSGKMTESRESLRWVLAAADGVASPG